MRNCIYLLCLASLLVYSSSSLAHPHDREGGVIWDAYTLYHEDSDTRLSEAFGDRTIWGIRESNRDTYIANRHKLTSTDYNKVLVTYTVRNHRRRRHENRGHQHNIAVGLAHQISEHHSAEVAIEHFDQSRSSVIDVDDIRGVFYTRAGNYGGGRFGEEVLDKLGKEWRQRFPTDDGQRYDFIGIVVALFSDNTVLFQVSQVEHGTQDSKPLADRPVVLLNISDLVQYSWHR